MIQTTIPTLTVPLAQTAAGAASASGTAPDFAALLGGTPVTPLQTLAPTLHTGAAAPVLPTIAAEVEAIALPSAIIPTPISADAIKDAQDGLAALTLQAQTAALPGASIPGTVPLVAPVSKAPPQAATPLPPATPAALPAPASATVAATAQPTPAIDPATPQPLPESAEAEAMPQSALPRPAVPPRGQAVFVAATLVKQAAPEMPGKVAAPADGKTGNLSGKNLPPVSAKATDKVRDEDQPAAFPAPAPKHAAADVIALVPVLTPDAPIDAASVAVTVPQAEASRLETLALQASADAPVVPAPAAHAGTAAPAPRPVAARAVTLPDVAHFSERPVAGTPATAHPVESGRASTSEAPAAAMAQVLPLTEAAAVRFEPITITRAETPPALLANVAAPSEPVQQACATLAPLPLTGAARTMPDAEASAEAITGAPKAVRAPADPTETLSQPALEPKPQQAPTHAQSVTTGRAQRARAAQPEAETARGSRPLAENLARGETAKTPAEAPVVRTMRAETAAQPSAPDPAAPAIAGPLAAAAEPGAPAAAPATEAPLDFDTLVSRLADAREAASPHVVRTAFEHAEFGRVAMQVQHEDGGLNVTLSSRDPEFASAVQAAAASVAAGFAGGSGSNGDQPRHDQPPAQQQNAASQNTAQAGTGGQGQQARTDASGQQARRDGQPGFAGGQERDRRQDSSDRGRSQQPSQGSGVYA
jgi:hypothetical protein